ncbi:MAG: nuclear transport factor 2 family protein [Pseudomonadota bacterium]
MTSARENAINLYMHGIRDGHPEDAVAAYTGDRYTQHSTGVADGQEGFIAFFKPFIKRNPIRDIQIVRALQDGPKVFVTAYQSLNNGESEWVTTDFFDSDETGKIIGHWDVIAPFMGANPSGRTQVDGLTKVTDIDKTEANRALVTAFIQTVLIDGKTDDVEAFINPDKYLQHNPEVGDGLDNFIAFWNAPNRPLTYQENFMTVAEGNFVATLNRARHEDQDLCQVDIFRVEDGLIVEHWDNSEPVPPKEEWANSGKF